MAPPNCPLPNPGTSRCDQIKDFEMGDYPDYPGQPEIIIRALKIRELFPTVSRENCEDACNSRKRWCCLKTRGGAPSLGTWWPLEAGQRAEIQTLPLSFQKRTSPADTLIVNQREPWRTSYLQECKIISLCCFKAFFIFCVLTSNVTMDIHEYTSLSALFSGFLKMKWKFLVQRVWVFII